MSSPKKCPNCGLINPDIAQRCDCGYDFECGEIKSPYVKPSRKKHLLRLESINKAPLGIKIIGIVNLIFAIAAGLILCVIILGTVFQHGDIPLASTGVDGIFVVATLLAVIIGVCTLIAVASIHLMMLKKWAWYFFIVAQGLGLIIASFKLLKAEHILANFGGLLLNMVILWYLFSKRMIFGPSLSQISPEKGRK